MNGYRKLIFHLFILFGLPANSFSQKSDAGNWFIYFGNQALNNKWNWHNEIQYRNYNVAGDLEQVLFRTGIGYNLSENNNNVLLGYGFIYGEKYINERKEDKIKSTEHRLFQQFITRQHFGRIFLQHRYRIEERFFPDGLKARFRYFLSMNIPVNKGSLTKNALYASCYNEVFLNAHSPVFDRNRVYAGVGFAFSKHLRAEAGWMSQLFEKTHRSQFQVIFFNNLPFHSK
jgi:hypothetical protein